MLLRSVIYSEIATAEVHKIENNLGIVYSIDNTIHKYTDYSVLSSLLARGSSSTLNVNFDSTLLI